MRKTNTAILGHFLSKTRKQTEVMPRSSVTLILIQCYYDIGPKPTHGHYCILRDPCRASFNS